MFTAQMRVKTAIALKGLPVGSPGVVERVVPSGDLAGRVVVRFDGKRTAVYMPADELRMEGASNV
jgi:hypothetical protein